MPSSIAVDPMVEGQVHAMGVLHLILLVQVYTPIDYLFPPGENCGELIESENDYTYEEETLE